MKNKVFNYKDQEIFSELSQDFNPIHLDKKWAEKEYPGQIIIYGISMLLWAIESTSHSSQIVRIKARFLQPAFLDESLSLKFSNTKKGKILTIFIRNNLIAKFEIFYGEKNLPSKKIKIEENKSLKIPRELSLLEISKENGIVDISENKFKNLEFLYPVSKKYIGVLGLKGLLSISRLISSIMSNFMYRYIFKSLN